MPYLHIMEMTKTDEGLTGITCFSIWCVSIDTSKTTVWIGYDSGCQMDRTFDILWVTCVQNIPEEMHYYSWTVQSLTIDT